MKKIEFNRRTKFFIIFGIIILTALFIYNVILSYGLSKYQFFHGDRLQFVSFFTAFHNLFISGKQRMYFLLLEMSFVFLIALCIYMKIAMPEKFKSDTVEITPKIHIPNKAGQGQYGTAWFLEDIFKNKDKKDAVFKHNVITYSDETIDYLLKTGEDDIKVIMKRLEEGVSIDVINDEIARKRIKEANEKKKEKEEFDFNEQLLDIGEFDEKDDMTEDEIDLIINDKIPDEYIDYENASEEEIQKRLFVDNIINEVKEKEEKNIKLEKPYNPKEDIHKKFDKGGLIVGCYKDNDEDPTKEYIYFIDKDTHSVIIGATRSGKSRCLVMQSIGNTALAGESMVITDPKGELYAYTSGFMKKLGYEVICINFKDTNVSSHYNLLQPIINAKKDNDIEKIVKYTQELSNMLVEDVKGENKLWTNGERALITGSILALILGQNDEELMNLTNVYRFIDESQDKDLYKGQQNMNLLLYIQALKQYDNTNPIINAFTSATKGAKETAGSFFTSATATLNLYSQPSMWQITHKSNIDLAKMGERKQIVYFVLPDDDTSYYSIVSIIVKQMYNELVKISDKYGGRLPIRVNFFLDEFGNFTKIPDLPTMLTVAGGRGMRFNLFLQDFSQIVLKYDKETANIVKSNCETWVYLKATDPSTLKEISEKLGKYTMYSNSESMNIQNNDKTSSSSSQNLQGRNLLLPEEIGKIERPYLLVMQGSNYPAMNKAPDISNLSFNKFYGMGGEEYNNRLRMIRDRQRTITRSNEEMDYWSLYRDMQQYIIKNINLNEDQLGHTLKEPRQLDEMEVSSVLSQYLQQQDVGINPIEDMEEMYK